MSKLEWDKTGEREFEAGVDKGVLYLLRAARYSNGQAWNGLINVNESPSGAEPSPLFADNIKYANLISTEELGLGVEAYAYPTDFNECLGKTEIARGVFIGQQKRYHFGFVYRTLLGNDENGIDNGYKINIIFDCVASSSEGNHSTENETPEAMNHSWDISTTPQIIEGYKPTAKLTLTSTDFKKAGLWNVLQYIEGILFGTDTTNPRLPKIPEILEFVEIQKYIRDNNNEALLDSSGKKIMSRVFE